MMKFPFNTSTLNLYARKHRLVFNFCSSHFKVLNEKKRNKNSESKRLETLDRLRRRFGEVEGRECEITNRKITPNSTLPQIYESRLNELGIDPLGYNLRIMLLKTHVKANALLVLLAELEQGGDIVPLLEFARIETLTWRINDEADYIADAITEFIFSDKTLECVNKLNSELNRLRRR